ncbi:MAG: hypothetical protein ABI650_09655 [Dokdonella sp.]
MTNPALAPSTSAIDTPAAGFVDRLRARERLWHAAHVTRRAAIALAVLALALNAALLFGLHEVMVVSPYAERASDAIQVSVIEPVQALPIPDEPQPAVFVRRPSRIAIQPPQARVTPPPPTPAAFTESDARIGAAGDAAPRLFNADGSLRMPQTSTRIDPERVANPQEAGKAAWAEIEKRGETPLDCERTRFADSFRRDESVGDGISRKYLSWIGLADRAVIEERAAQKAQRAADGCDPAS